MGLSFVICWRAPLAGAPRSKERHDQLLGAGHEISVFSKAYKEAWGITGDPGRLL
jgi:hypothetical protein